MSPRRRTTRGLRCLVCGCYYAAGDHGWANKQVGGMCGDASGGLDGCDFRTYCPGRLVRACTYHALLADLGLEEDLQVRRRDRVRPLQACILLGAHEDPTVDSGGMGAWICDGTEPAGIDLASLRRPRSEQWARNAG